MKYRRHILAGVLVFGLSGVAVYLAFVPRPKPARTTVRVCVERNFRNTLYLLAERNGYFDEEGLSIEPVESAGSPGAAVVRGDADLGVAGESELIAKLEEGEPLFILGSIYLAASSDVDTHAAVLIAFPSSHAANPDSARKFMRALLRAERFLAASPEEGRRKLADVYPAGGWDERLLTLLHVGLDPMLLIVLEEEIRHRRGPGRYVPNLLKFIDFRPLEATEPNAISIIH